MKTKLTTNQAIARVAARHEEDGWAFRARYSGRCMYGRCCPGITCPRGHVQAVTAAVRKAGIRGHASTDNMGLDMIVYWPGIEADPEPVASES